jgi:hypothetical protein
MVLNEFTIEQIGNMASEMKRNFPLGMDIIDDTIYNITIVHLTYKVMYPSVHLAFYGPIMQLLFEYQEAMRSSGGNLFLFKRLTEGIR